MAETLVVCGPFFFTVEKLISRWAPMIHNRRPQRVLIAGVPPVYQVINIPDLVEKMGGIVVFDESCAGRLYLDSSFGTIKICREEKANMAVFTKSAPCIPYCLGAVDERALLITRMAEVFCADGLLFYVLKGFAIYDMVLCRVEKVMKEKNIPLLRIETDYGFENTETFKADIEAFIESLPSGFAEACDRWIPDASFSRR